MAATGNMWRVRVRGARRCCTRMQLSLQGLPYYAALVSPRLVGRMNRAPVLPHSILAAVTTHRRPAAKKQPIHFSRFWALKARPGCQHGQAGEALQAAGS